MNSKAKILYFVHLPPPVHGVSKCNELVVNSIYINENLHKRVLNINYNTSLETVNKFGPNKIFKYFKTLVSFFIELVFHRPDLIYYTIPPTGIGLYKDIPYILILKVLQIHPIFHLHGKGIYENVSDSSFKKELHRFIYSKSSIIHLSNNLLEREILRLNIRKSNYYVVNNGIENNTISNSYVKESNDIQVLFLSNLRISKGILMAFEIIKKIRDETDIKFKFNVVGEFKDETTKKIVMTYVGSNNLSEVSQFHGALYGKNKFELLNKMDVLLYPSFNDAFPLVILEALQSGLPVIASDQGAIPEMIDDTMGVVFKTGDINDAFSKFKSILSLNEKNRIDISNNCRKIFSQKYTTYEFEKNIKKVISEALKKPLI